MRDTKIVGNGFSDFPERSKNDWSICSSEAVSYYVVTGKTKMVMSEEEHASSIGVKKKMRLRWRNLAELFL